MEFDEQPASSLSARGCRHDTMINSIAESFRARTGFPRASVLDWGFAVRGSNENRKPERGSCGVPRTNTQHTADCSERRATHWRLAQ